MLDGHEFYGYFPGGASGGILPASMNKIPLDFGTLEEYGCFIGSAAVVILSDKDKARNAAKTTIDFLNMNHVESAHRVELGHLKHRN